MKNNLLLYLFFSLLLCGCAHSDKMSLASGVSPSEINAGKSTAENQRIELHGYLVHESESYGVWDSRDAMENGEISACLSLLYPAKIKDEVIRANKKPVRIVGKFRNNVASNSGVRLGLCNYTGVFVEAIEIDR